MNYNQVWKIGEEINMNLKKPIVVTIIAVLLVLLFNGISSSRYYSVYAQQPTGSVPTVTGTPKGPMARSDTALLNRLLMFAQVQVPCTMRLGSSIWETRLQSRGNQSVEIGY